MKQRGLSLIEMVVALLVLAVIGAASGSALIGGVTAFSETGEDLQMLGKLRYASERMAREVREVRRDPANRARYDISEMSPDRLQFTSGNGTTVTFAVNKPLLSLAYQVPAGEWTLVDDVTGMEFTYFQSDGLSAATSGADVAYVEFNLELSRSGKAFPQRTRVALRNRQ